MAASENCGRCGEEVRYGARGLILGYLHREDVDHAPIFGTPWTPEFEAQLEAQLDLPRERFVPTKTGWPLLFDIVPYTTREFDIARMKKAAREAAAAEAEALEPDDDEEEGEEPGAIEVYSTPLPLREVIIVDTPNGPRHVSAPQGLRTIANAAINAGWEIFEVTYSRGPYMGAKGLSLGTCDFTRLVVRPLDGSKRLGIGWWRDNKSTTAWRVEGGRIHRVGAKALKDWIKEEPRAEE